MLFSRFVAEWQNFISEVIQSYIETFIIILSSFVIELIVFFWQFHPRCRFFVRSL